MNWEQMEKNVGARVQLKPTPHRLDDYGRKLPPIAYDWLIEEVSADGVRIRNVRMHHTTILGKDHTYDYVSNPDQSQHGWFFVVFQNFNFFRHAFYSNRVNLSRKPEDASDSGRSHVDSGYPTVG